MLPRSVSRILAAFSFLVVGFVLIVGSSAADAKEGKGKKGATKAKVEARAEAKGREKAEAKEKGPDKQKETDPEKKDSAKAEKKEGKSDESHGKGMAMGKTKVKGEGLALGKGKEAGGLAVGKGHVEKPAMENGRKAQLAAQAEKKMGPMAKEQRKYVKRQAKFIRLLEIAQKQGNNDLLKRVLLLRQKEMKRHSKKMMKRRHKSRIKMGKAMQAKGQKGKPAKREEK